MKRLIVLYDSLPRLVRGIIGALGTALPFYFSALLGQLIAREAEAGGYYVVAIHAAVFIVLITVVVAIVQTAAGTRVVVREEQNRRLETLAHARRYMDRVVAQRLADVRGTPLTDDSLVGNLCVSLACIQRLVEGAYATFETAFGRGLQSEKRIDFEVTFMTKSYRDGHITIPAYANNDGRAPRSMVLRAQNLQIYDSTVTAQIYREAGPTIHIVEDTATADYESLYAGQKDRIKSSIIFPVLSDKNELLGTLVVHCDKRSFFLQRDQKYWRDILEIFAKRIALMKDRMDVLWQAKNVGGSIAALVPDAWF